MTLLVALLGHLRLEGTHPPAPRVPILHSLAGTRLHMAPLVALSGAVQTPYSLGTLGGRG